MMFKNHSTVLSFLLLLVIQFSAFGQASDAAQKTQAALEKILEEKGIPGISVSIIQNDQTENICAGYADPDQEIKMTPQHRLLSGSIGKTYFATQVMLLVEQGILDLDAKAMQYMKDEAWFATVQNAPDITIRSLLNHTSGVPEYVYAPEMWQIAKDDLTKQWTAAERLAFIKDQPPHFPTGKGWSYADANFIILGAIVEKVTGKAIYEMVDQNILKPLGLDQTQPSIQPKMKGLTAAYTGRMFGDIFGEKVSSMGEYAMGPQFEWTGGGFITTPSDLAKWVYQLNQGKILQPQSLQQMNSPVNRQTGFPANTGYGFGAEVFASSRGIAYGHSGFMPGFLSLTAYLPEYDMAVALQVNSDPYSSRMKGRITVFDLMETVLEHYTPKVKSYKKATKVYLVRHAEKADDGTRDPDLNEAGKKRAKELAKVLADKNIDAIYSTPYKRTRQTAAPLAKQLGKEVQTWSPSSMMQVYEIIANNPGKSVLIVGHSNTTPAMVNLIAPKVNLQQLDESAYGDLFLVTYKKGKGKLKRSKF